MRFLFTLLTFVTLFTNSLFAQNVVKQCTPAGIYYSCGAQAAHQSEQGPWFDFVINGNQASWYQGYGIESASWKEYDNGTAKLTGRLYQIINKINVKFDINLTFSNKGSGSPHGGGDGWHCLPSNTNDWYYYRAATGTLTGVSGTHVQGVTFTASLVAGSALQIGTGGSINSTTKYGMSAWLNLTQTGGWNVCWKKGGSDLYFDLNNCTATPPPPTCSNFTSGGSICCDQTGCAPFDPTIINSTALPTGGSGNIEYLWLKSTTASTLTTANAAQWQTIAGATGSTYDPGAISQTTWFIRCARRSGCTDYVGESNVVKMTVTGNCNTGGNCPNLVVNGGFNQGFTGFTTEIRKNNWADCGNGGSINIGATPHAALGFAATCADHNGDGAQLVVDFAAGDIWQKVWQQQVNVQTNTNYTFTFWAQTVYPANPAKLYAIINTQTFPVTTLPTTECQWTKYQVQWNSGSSTTANLMIKNNNPDCNGNDFAIDDISLTCNGGITPGTCAVAVTASNNGPKCVGQNIQLSATGTSNSTGTTGGTSLGANLVTNSNFDAGNTGFTSELIYKAWDGGCDNYTVTSTPQADWKWPANCTDHTGNNGKMLAFDSPTGDAWKVHWKQCIAVQPNTTYEFSYWATSLFSGNPAKLYAVFNNMNAGNVTPITLLTSNTCQWQKITFTWNSGSATQACIMLKNDNGDCNGNDFAIDDISLRPIVTTTPNTCTPSYVWTGPNGYTSTQQNPTVTAAGIYTVTYKDQFCCTATASTTVVAAPAPTLICESRINDGNWNVESDCNVFVCSGSKLMLSVNPNVATVNWTGPNGFSVTAQNDILVSNAITAAQAGSYKATLTDANGCVGTATIIVTISPTLTTNITGNTTVCNGVNTTLTATGGVSYQWSNGATTASITVGAGTYTVTVTNLAGCTASKTATVTNSPNAAASITGTLQICNGSTTTLTAQGGGTYVWSNGSTAASITVGAGNYSVTVTNAAGCKATASATVISSSAPSANITGNLSVCNNGTTTLTATGGGTYAWSNGATSASITVNAGTYTVVVTNAAGCTASKTVTVTNSQFTTSITGNLSVCTGQTTTLTAQGNGTYAWSNGATTQSITVGAGTYSVVVTNGTCSASASATVISSSAPSANITGNLSVCNNGTTTLTATGGGTYAWSNGATSASITVNAGTYTVVVTNAAGCTASKTVTVTNSQFTTSITGNLSVCTGQTTTLTAQGNGTYAWSNGATTQSITVGAGTYSVVVTNGTCSASASATVISSSAPSANITGNLSVCNNGTTTLTATGGGTYAWSNGATSASITVNAGTYTVVVTNAAGCTASKTVTVTNSNVIASITGNTTICTGATTTLTAFGGTTYKWSNGSTSASITVAAGVYSVTVTNAAGCSDVASKTVVANNCNTSSVGDFVFCDKNGNGVQDAGEPGIAGVTVTLTGTDVNGNPVTLTTTTDANGSYSFANLAAGTYKVTFANPNGYVVTSQDKGGNDTTDSDINSTGMTPTFMLGVGQSNTTIDAGYFQPASLGNFVFNDLNNNGVQDAGESGIAGVTVSLSGTKGDGTLVSLSTTTDANGAYSFTNLAPGTYSIKFGKPTGFNGSPQDQGGNDATDSDANPTTGTTAPVTLTSGQNNTTIDAGFNRPCNIGINITNKICNNNNTPSNPDDDTYSFTMTVTGGTGTWTGSYDNAFLGVFAFAPTAYNTPIVLGPFPAGKFTSSNTFPPIVVLNGLDINIHVNDAQYPNCLKSTTVISTGPCSNANSSIGDKVFCDKNANGIQDTNEPGQAGVTVILTGTDTQGNTVNKTLITDANGNYLFTNLAPGTYQVTFSNLPAGFKFTAQDKSTNDAADSDANTTTGKTGNITLAINESNLTIDAGIFQPAKLGDFVFNDLDNDGIQDAGEPGIEGVTVTLNGTAGDGTPVTLTTTTDANGAYSFINLTPGTYTVTFAKPTGFNGSPSNQGTDPTKDSDANPTTGATATITLTSGQNNTTVDAGFNKPIQTTTIGDFVFLDCNKNGIQDAGETGVANVPVILKNATTGATTASTTTNANGIYSFTNVAAGSYTITFGTVKNLTFTGKDLGGNDATDSDANTNGTTDVFTVAGVAINTIDAGLQDNVKPIFAGIPADATVECSAVPAAATPTATDNYDQSVTITYNQIRTAGSCADSYLLTRTWTASDDCGNTCTGVQKITVKDTQKPVFAGVPADITIACGTPTPSVATPTATDNCDQSVTITFVETSAQDNSGACPKTIISRTWTATDNCGNAEVKTQKICLTDNQGPVISGVPADVTVLCSAIPSVATGITAADACSPSAITVVFSTQTSTIAGAYLVKRIWTATDICGNKTIKTQVICAKDTQKPTFTGVPADDTVECNAVPAATNPVAKDNCDTKMPVTLTEVRIPGACPYSFTIKRTWKVTDDAGNSCEVTQTLTVRDTKAPVITGVPANVTIQCGDAIPLPPSTITATDNCSSYVPITFSEIFYQGNCDGKSEILCQWVAKDDCGNTTVKQWRITISGASARIAAPNSKNNKTAALSVNDITVFPNPTRDEITVQFNGQKVTRITVLDITGRMIQNIDQTLEDSVQLQLGNQAKGVYTIQLHTTNGIVAKRITLID